MLSSIARAHAIERHRCCYTATYVRLDVEEHRGGRSHSRSRSRSGFALALLLVGAKLPSELFSLLFSVACGCKSSLARACVFGYIFVVHMVAVACLGSRARASAPMRDPLLVVRRRFGCVSSFVHVNDGLVGVLSRYFGVAPGAVGGVVARARVLALLVGACFLVWSVVGRY